MAGLRDRYFYTLFGSMWADGGDLGGPYVQISLAGALHWYLGVSAINVSYLFESVDRACADNFIQYKEYPGDSNRTVGDDGLVAVPPDILNLHPCWGPRLLPFPPFSQTFASGLCRGRTLPLGSTESDGWAMSFAPICISTGFVPNPGDKGNLTVSSTPDQFNAGTYTLAAIDPITGEDYSVTGAMYSQFSGVLGSLLITPNEYYTYDGLYSPTTGG